MVKYKWLVSGYLPHAEGKSAQCSITATNIDQAIKIARDYGFEPIMHVQNMGQVKADTEIGML
jgi:hypothetical protein